MEIWKKSKKKLRNLIGSVTGQFHSPENLAKSISIEAGELLECFQWNDDYNIDELRDHIKSIVQ